METPRLVFCENPVHAQQTKITYYGDSGQISALAPNGQVMFLHGRRYLQSSLLRIDVNPDHLQ
jgi:hypothetical protein